MTSRSPPAWRVRMTRPAAPGVVRYQTDGPVSPQFEKGSVRRSTVASCVVPLTVAGSGSSDCADARLSFAGAAARALAGAQASAARQRTSSRRDTMAPWAGGRRWERTDRREVTAFVLCASFRCDVRWRRPRSRSDQGDVDAGKKWLLAAAVIGSTLTAVPAG